MCYFGTYGMYTYNMYTCDKFLWRIFFEFWLFLRRSFVTNFCDEFWLILWRIFVTNFIRILTYLVTIFFRILLFLNFFLTFNLLTIASFRIGVPSILFFYWFVNLLTKFSIFKTFHQTFHDILSSFWHFFPGSRACWRFIINNFRNVAIIDVFQNNNWSLWNCRN